MKTIQMEICGTVKVVYCQKSKEKHEPVPNCTKCKYSITVDYAAGKVECKFTEQKDET
jgi:hypothetical protein